MKKYVGLFGPLVLVLALTSCGGGGDSTAPPPPPPPPPGCPAATFCMGASSFTPASRTVTAGTTVTWQNDSGVIHNVTWDNAAGRAAAQAGDGTGDIGDFGSGSHTRLFTAAGSYGFHCTIHAGMNGSLVVQ